MAGIWAVQNSASESKKYPLTVKTEKNYVTIFYGFKLKYHARLARKLEISATRNLIFADFLFWLVCLD